MNQFPPVLLQIMKREVYLVSRRWFLLAMIVMMSLIAGSVPALANNTHTINGVYHGCGDCNTGTGFYLHPFTDKNTNTFKKVWLYRRGAFQESMECDTCSHVHVNWDTGGNLECEYSSDHEVSFHLNKHKHWSHLWSSYC